MTVAPAAKLQEAVFSALKQDVDLGFQLAGIYDEAPIEAAYPYLAMGQTTCNNNDLKTTSATTIDFELFVWSSEASQMQVKDLMAAVEESLDKAELVVPGYDLLSLRVITASTVRQWDESGTHYRGRLSYKAQLYEGVPAC